MRLKYVLGAAILMVLSTPAMAQECARWGEPAELSGILVEGIYPGPPEYESVERGDAAYTALLLHLTTPICVSEGFEPGEPAIESTELVQLACSPKRISRLKSGERITVSGTLFSAHTGYHVTPALLDCQ